MGKELKLTIELIPKTSWYKSLRKEMSQKEWNNLKSQLFEKEGKKCWICGAEGVRLEAHETWKYNFKKKIQKLEEIHHICQPCHKVKHVGLWTLTDLSKDVNEEDLINHFCKVNGCSKEDYKNHKDEAFVIYRKRSKIKWIPSFINLKNLSP